MLGNLIGLVALVALVVLFAWLTFRAWHVKRWFVKWPLLVLGGLLTLLPALISAVAGAGAWNAYVPRAASLAQVQVAGTAAQVARGEHIAHVLCAECHAANGHWPMAGGANL